MVRPSKPTPDFPLFAHANGQWAKKINGQLCYFGAWSDPQAALAKYAAGHQKHASIAKPAKPVKPASLPKDYPLSFHKGSGQFCKKVRGRAYYFGSDPQVALERWNAQKDALFAGHEPALTSDELTVRQLVNHFLTAKKHAVTIGELQQRTWNDYNIVCGRIVAVFSDRPVSSLVPADFAKLRAAFATTHGPVALANDIGRARVVFNYGYGAELVDRPPRYGKEFQKPSRRTLRCERARRGKRLFQAEQIRAMIGAAGTQLHAMVLLGINCGYGNTDCATLPMQALDLRKGWVDFPRPKTGVPRRCPLWPETVAALQEAIKDRPEPSAEFANRVFVTRRKAGWEAQSRLSKKGTTVVDDPISKETAKLLKRLGFHRSGLGFYALRHTFQTVGGLDKDAIGYIMGHVAGANDMGAVYNEEAPEDGRLLAVVNHIHSWLFPAAQ